MHSRQTIMLLRREFANKLLELWSLNAYYFYKTGARRSNTSILASIQELQDARSQLASKVNELNEIEKELQGIQAVAEKWGITLDWYTNPGF